MTSRIGLVLALLFGSFGACTVTPHSTDTAAAPTTAAPPDGETPTPPTDATPKAPVGGACSTNADCDGGVCEGEGCGEMMGKCAATERMCTRDLQTYCGCDGVEFSASGSCPGARFSKRGPCEAAATPKPDGSPCTAATDCASGVCEGEGCDKPGVCVAANRPCTKDLRQYCGCDGKTFSGSGSCPGARFSKRSAC
jgi:hypothetical protein